MSNLRRKVLILFRISLNFRQNPQLEGDNKHRIVFNSKVAEWVYTSYTMCLDDSGQYILNTGAVDGVCSDAAFTIYADHGGFPRGPNLGVMVPDEVETLRTIMRPLSEPGPSLDKTTFAIQTRSGALEGLKIFMPLEDPLIPAFKATLMKMKALSHVRHRVTLVDDPSVAHLAIERENDEIAFVFLDKRVTAHGITKYALKAKAADMIPVLQGAAHYHYHLNRSYLAVEELEELIKVEVFKLEFSSQLDEGTTRLLRRPSGKNLLEDGIISLSLHDGANDVFGIRITNTSAVDLYPSIFYFNNSELSISGSSLYLYMFWSNLNLQHNISDLEVHSSSKSTHLCQGVEVR